MTSRPLSGERGLIRRALTRQTRWYQNRCSTFKVKDVIVEKPFWKILEFWPLVTSILTWAKKWLKWFRNAFSRAFERCFSFFSTATRSRDHGGGAFKRPPPPPSRRWKIQRPSRARVKGRVSTDIGNMELWARGWRIYFSELTVSFKPQGKFFNSLYFEHPMSKICYDVLSAAPPTHFTTL